MTRGVLSNMQDMQTENDPSQTMPITYTGEPFQPVRIYYFIRNRSLVTTKFSKMKCMNADKTNRCWVWLYEHEAKELVFERSYVRLEDQVRPLSLGCFYFNPPSEMYLEVQSVDRAVQALLFFDKFLGRKMAEVKDFSILTRLLKEDEIHTDYTDFFTREVRKDPEELLKDIERQVGETKDQKQVMALLEKDMKQVGPEVERKPLNFYENNFDSIRHSFDMYKTIAVERWAGNTNFSFYDLFQKLTAKH